MKKLKNLLLAAILGAILVGCHNTFPMTATAAPTGGKIGRATGKCVLGICWGMDLSVLTAAKNGNLKRIATVDFKNTNYVFWIRYETIVSGN